MVSIFIAQWLVSSCGSNDAITTPTVKPLMEAVYASGYVVAKDEYQVYAQAEGYLVEKLVDDGDTVKKGDPMFVIDAGQQTARYQVAWENYAMASKNHEHDSPVLQELKVATEVARTKKQFDSLNFVRYTNLWKSNATSRAEFDRMKLLYENSQNEYRLQSSRYSKINNQLFLELKNAENQLRIAKDESARYTLRSKIDGMIFKVMKKEGEMIRRGEVIGVVGSKNNFYLELTVDELDVRRVQLGQEVLVKIEAYPDQIFHATVSQLYPMIDKRQQSVQVDAVLKEPLPGWFSGLALEANIVIRQKEDAIVIPKAALLPGDSVLIKTDDGERKIKVTKGIETLDEVEVTNGIDSQTHLLIQ